MTVFLTPNTIQAQCQDLEDDDLLDIRTCNASRDLKCTSKDLSVVGAFLGDGCTPCSDGATVPLYFRINNTTGSFRTAFAVWATLEIKDKNGVLKSNCPFRQCVADVPPNTITEIAAVDVEYTCGDIWTLKNVLLAWTDAADNSTCAAITCRNVSPKCGRAADIAIVTPVSCNATVTKRPCAGVSNGEISVSATGGVAPYTFSLGSTTKTTNPATFTGLAAGSYTFTVTDSDTREGGPCTSTCTVTITNLPNPTAPTSTFVPPTTCTDVTYDVRVNNPVVGSTYKLTHNGATTSRTHSSGTLVFTNLTIGIGYSLTETNSDGCVSNADQCPTVAPAPLQENTGKKAMNNDAVKSKPTIIAAPNPFNDKVRFTISAPESGQVTLELYNLLGQSVKTLFKGNIEKGVEQTVEYDVPMEQRSMLIYLLKMGDEKVTGKLISSK